MSPIPAAILKDAREKVNHLRKDPLIADYLDLLENHSPFANTQPWHARAEQHTRSFEIISHLDLYDESPLIYPEDSEGRLALIIGESLLEAETFLWTNETYKVARSLPLPKHKVDAQALTRPLMFFSFETAWGFSDEFENNWILLGNYPNQKKDPGILITFDLHKKGNEGFKIVSFAIPHGMDYPVTVPYADEGIKQVVDLVLRLLAFVNSPYVDNRKMGAPRPLRRRLQRAGQTAPEIQVISLRRREDNGIESDPQERDSNGREYSHRWWVSGHYRAQWYASRQAHKVIWIDSYLKGPEDRPMLQHVYKVSR